MIAILYQIFLFFDWAVYGIAGTAYNLIFSIAKFSTSADFAYLTEPINAVIDRIQILLGIFMLFRLAISLIQFLANPSKLEQDGSKIVLNFFIAIIMLASSNFVFDTLDKFQDVTVGSNNAISNIIFGLDENEQSLHDSSNPGKIVTNRLFLNFISVVPYGDNKTVFFISNLVTGILDPISGAKTSIASVFGPDFSDAYTGIYEGDKSILDLSPFVGVNTLTNDGYIVNYQFPILSTAVGGYFLFFFFSVAIKVAIRMFKLLLLKTIAPIPILSYVDPKGKKYFMNFIKLYGKTYLDFFIRIATVYFAMIAINLVQRLIITAGSFLYTNIILGIVLILAILKVSKEIPELISKIFGLDMAGLGGMEGKGFLSSVAGGVLGLSSGMIAGRSRGLDWGQSIGTGVTGAVRGAQSGSKAKNLSDFVKGQVSTYKGSASQATSVGNVGGWKNYAGGLVRNVTGTTGKMERKIAFEKSEAEKFDRIKDAGDIAFEKSLVAERDMNGKIIYRQRGSRTADPNVQAKEAQLSSLKFYGSDGYKRQILEKDAQQKELTYNTWINSTLGKNSFDSYLNTNKMTDADLNKNVTSELNSRYQEYAKSDSAILNQSQFYDSYRDETESRLRTEEENRLKSQWESGKALEQFEENYVAPSHDWSSEYVTALGNAQVEYDNAVKSYDSEKKKFIGDAVRYSNGDTTVSDSYRFKTVAKDSDGHVIKDSNGNVTVSEKVSSQVDNLSRSVEEFNRNKSNSNANGCERIVDEKTYEIATKYSQRMKTDASNLERSREYQDSVNVKNSSNKH